MKTARIAQQGVHHIVEVASSANISMTWSCSPSTARRTCATDIATAIPIPLLARHGIGDPGWIAAWLEFKREYHEARLAEIAKRRRFVI